MGRAAGRQRRLRSCSACSPSRRPQPALLDLAWAGALIALVALAATPDAPGRGRARSAGSTTRALVSRPDRAACCAGSPPALPFLALARIEPRRSLREPPPRRSPRCWPTASLAQVVPADWLAWTAALGAIALCLALPGARGGWGALLGVALLWTLVPFVEWIADGGRSRSAAIPLLLDGVPGWRDVLLRLVPFALAAGVAAWRNREPAGRSRASGSSPRGHRRRSSPCTACTSCVFAIGTAEDFIRLGMAERTVWQALLARLGLRAGLARAGRPGSGPRRSRCSALSLAHFAWFTLLLHNPLWSGQAVGPVAARQLAAARLRRRRARAGRAQAPARRTRTPGSAGLPTPR